MSNEQAVISTNVQASLESHLDDLDNIKAVVTAIHALSSAKNLEINGKIKELTEQAIYLVDTLHNDIDLIREDLVVQG